MTRGASRLATLLALLPATVVAAQTPPAAAPIPAPDRQVSAAVLALPATMRDSATVLGYREAGSLVELRRGTNGMICLADNPADSTFHVACYHESLEPFMARGRALRASGVTGEQVDTVRFREIAEGTLKNVERSKASRDRGGSTPTAAVTAPLRLEGLWSPRPCRLVGSCRPCFTCRCRLRGTRRRPGRNRCGYGRSGRSSLDR